MAFSKWTLPHTELMWYNMDKKRGASMKKKVVILSICAIFLLSGSVLGATNSKVGKKITSEASVYLDGQLLSAAIITEGSSFAPVRVISEALGLDVKYETSKEGSVIKLTSPEAKELSWEDIKKVSDLKANIVGANNEIQRLNQEIEYATKQLETATHEVLVKTLEKSIAEAKDQIIVAQENIITYTNELLALETAE